MKFALPFPFLSLIHPKTPSESEQDETVDPILLEQQSPEDNDYLLALMLQHEFNNEFNGMMKKYESTVNRKSKVKVSMKNFMLLPGPKINHQDKSNNEDDDEEVEPSQETFSDCEQGTIGFFLLFPKSSSILFQINECHHSIVEALAGKVNRSWPNTTLNYVANVMLLVWWTHFPLSSTREMF